MNTPAAKPLLRGWSHAVGAVAAAIAAVVLIGRANDSIKLAAFSIYSASLVFLLGFSALYHIPKWSPSKRALMRRIDHANIFILIAGTNTPVIAVLLSGAWRISLLVTTWTLAIVGVALSTPVIRSRRRLLALIYVVIGWVGVIGMPKVLAKTGASILWIVLGGLLYCAGAVVYATQKPRLWPRIWGYHEVFHACVLAASASFYVFMLGVVANQPTAA